MPTKESTTPNGGRIIQTTKENGDKKLGEKKKNLNESKTEFEITYRTMLDGTASREWQQYQLPNLPKHRINHVSDQFFCTCGAGPFSETLDWCNHAAGRKIKMGVVNKTARRAAKT